MEEEPVSYEALQDLLRTERRGNKLTPLPPRFWSYVRGFLEEVTDAFRKEQAKDPFSRKVMLLTDEVKNARHAAHALWALRERKLAMLALAHTHERQRPSGITPDEGSLYDAVLRLLDGSREDVLGVRVVRRPDAPDVPPAAAKPTAPAPETAPDATPESTDETEAETETPTETAPVERIVPPDTPDDGLVEIRALADIPPFVGPDMQTYLLKQGDLATVPLAMARLLERRQKAALVGVK